MECPGRVRRWKAPSAQAGPADKQPLGSGGSGSTVPRARPAQPLCWEAQSPGPRVTLKTPLLVTGSSPPEEVRQVIRLCETGAPVTTLAPRMELALFRGKRKGQSPCTPSHGSLACPRSPAHQGALSASFRPPPSVKFQRLLSGVKAAAPGRHGPFSVAPGVRLSR